MGTRIKENEQWKPNPENEMKKGEVRQDWETAQVGTKTSSRSVVQCVCLERGN